MAAVEKTTLDKYGLAKVAGTLTVYNYDPLTGLFMSASDEQLVQGVGIPASSTCSAPPAAVAGKVSVFINDDWQQIPDYRGETVYKTADGSAYVVTMPGDYPADTTSIKPATVYDKWDGVKWVTDADAQEKAGIEAAEKLKAALISEANNTTQAWQTQLRLEIITDEDKASLIKWMKYVQSVQTVNTSSQAEISWPQKPE